MHILENAKNFSSSIILDKLLYFIEHQAVVIPIFLKNPSQSQLEMIEILKICQ